MKVLLSSAGAKVPLLQALKTAAVRLQPDAVVIAGDSSKPVVSQYFADHFWHMPLCNESNLHAIKEGLAEYQITHIVPSRDGELMFWSEQKEALKPLGIEVLVSAEEVIRLCLDKFNFAQVNTHPQCKVIPALLHPDESANLWVVKERYGAGSQNIGLKLTTQEALHHAKTMQSPLYQPFIQGTEISVDAWLDKQSQLKGHIFRYRTKVQHGESQISQTVSLPQYDAQIKTLLEQLQLTGPVVLQAIIDHQQQLHIIECNSRFGGASTLGIKAGVDSLYWSLAESMAMDLTQMPFTPSSQTITQVRYAGDLYL
ncbi:MAG: ATP-grasp domain-containing protein [Gammaproteobacteria bacterium]|nr:ATP-grasp domain-containing protein [Gammaproteobacteria bacterium]